MKLSSYDKPYDLKLHLPTDQSVLSLLPSVLVFNAQFDVVAKLDMDPKNFQRAIGTTIFQEVADDPRTAKYALALHEAG